MLSTDSQVLLMLTSQLGLTPQAEFKPLTLLEYNLVARLLVEKQDRPAILLNLSLEQLQEHFSNTNLDPLRLFWLLQRGASIGFQAERLEAMGISIVTRAEKEYPQKLRERLRESAPAVLFYSGDIHLLGTDQPSVAVVGSRNVDEEGNKFAQLVGNACANSGYVLVSGGAKGVDTLAMNACIGEKGYSVGFLANDLDREVRVRQANLRNKELCLLTPYSPNAPFNVGNAMGRNKLIYAMSDFAIVVASDLKKGGTWAGATEALRKEWAKVFVLVYDRMPEGNSELIKLGANPLPVELVKVPQKLIPYLKSIAVEKAPKPLATQYSFGSIAGFSVKDQPLGNEPKKKR